MTITFADGSQLSEIGESVFQGCGLTSITIPESVESIGVEAFSGCSSLATVTFVEGSQLSKIGKCAFNDCGCLKSIEIPASVTTIGAGAFSGCSELTSVTVFWTEEEMLPVLGDDVFADIGDDPTLYVPFGTKAMYNAADAWKGFEMISPDFELAVSSVGWASMYLPCAVTIPEDVEVYYASAASGSTITLSKVEGILPKETGVIVKAAEGTVNFAESAEDVTAIEDNLFEGVLTDTEKTESVYVLSGASDEGNPQFKEYSGSKLNAFKAYLPKSKVVSGAKEISVVFGETTSINSVNENENENLYNLNGIRVGSSYKGIVIKNGKKMFNK